MSPADRSGRLVSTRDALERPRRLGMQAGAPAGARRAPASPRMQKLPSLQEPAGVLTNLCVILPGSAAQVKQSCRCLPESASKSHSFTAWRRGPSWGPRAAAVGAPLRRRRRSRWRPPLLACSPPRSLWRRRATRSRRPRRRTRAAPRRAGTPGEAGRRQQRERRVVAVVIERG
jgi:hypothetical protein